MKSEPYSYWLANIKGISSHDKMLMEQHLGNTRVLYEAEVSTLEQLSFLRHSQIEAIEASRATWDLEKEFQRLIRSNAQLITWQDPQYPYTLSTLHDAPYAIYLKGHLPDPSSCTVAIVGARACSPYGKRQTEAIASKLSAAGIGIISGMAIGIDGIAQHTILNHGGYSLAVLGCGVDICYPERHHALYRELEQCGGILSEYPLTDPPLRAHFPQRNRLISVMSDAVIVVEAREKSGSLITADFALEQGKDVYALPGPADSLLSRGCHRLIDQGAKILISPEELLKDLGAQYNKQREGTVIDTLPPLTEQEMKIASCLSDTPIKLSELELITGLKPQVLTSSLVSMQLKGVVREFSLQHYVRA